MATVLVPFTTALILSLALVPCCRMLARRWGYVAQPRTDRWHHRPVPLFGGVAIALSVFIAPLFLGYQPANYILVGCTAVIFVVGLFDDLLNLKASTKLIAEIVIASCFLFFGFSLSWTGSLTLDSILTIFWVVGITNAFNLLDNMDGLCAGIALIAGTALLSGLLASGVSGTGEIQHLALLLGAVAGFLVYNFHPASVFMGDAGSLFLGATFAGLTLKARALGTEQSSVLSIIVPPVLILLIPIMDTTLVTVSRLFSGRSAATGGRDHSSHRLVAIGLSERRAVAVLWALAVFAGIVGWAVGNLDTSWSLLFVSICLVLMAAFGAYLAHVRVYAEDELPSGSVTPLINTFTYKRRVAEVLLDFSLISIAYYAAYRLRFEGPDFQRNFAYFLRSLPIVLASHLTALFIVGAYRGMWRYFSLMDGVVFAKATLLGTVAAQLALLYLFRFENYSRTVFVIGALLLFVSLVLSRASFRLVGEFIAQAHQDGHRLVIYGAGDGGSIVLRELLKMSPRREVLGFIDDDPRKARVRVHGYPILGNLTHLEELVTRRHIEEVMISAKGIPDDTIDRLLQLCSVHGVTLSRFQIQLETLKPRASHTQAANVRPFPEPHEPRRRQSGGDPR